MRITSSAVSLSSAWKSSEVQVQKARLRVEAEAPRPKAAPAAPAPLSKLEASAGARSEVLSKGVDGAEAAMDPRMAALKRLVEWLTGRPMRLFEMPSGDTSASASEASSAAPAGQRAASGKGEKASNEEPGLFVEASFESVRIVEQRVEWRGSGTVELADGSKIAFDMKAGMSSSFAERISVAASSGSDPKAAKDPLMLSFDGSFGLSSKEAFVEGMKIRTASPSAAYLAFDRNGDGLVSGKSELFGPDSGNGFADLAALDSDGNGWVDEGDAAWSKLGLWSGEGAIVSIQESKVGAVYAGSTATPFDLRDGGGVYGAVRSTGLWLGNDGSSGLARQVDFMA